MPTAARCERSAERCGAPCAASSRSRSLSALLASLSRASSAAASSASSQNHSPGISARSSTRVGGEVGHEPVVHEKIRAGFVRSVAVVHFVPRGALGVRAELSDAAGRVPRERRRRAGVGGVIQAHPPKARRQKRTVLIVDGEGDVEIRIVVDRRASERLERVIVRDGGRGRIRVERNVRARRRRTKRPIRRRRTKRPVRRRRPRLRHPRRRRVGRDGTLDCG